MTDFAETYNFYISRFNFTPSDVSYFLEILFLYIDSIQLVYDDYGRDVTTFLHLDRGLELVDHHCFFFFEGPVSHVHHSSYETYDFDTQLLGHDYLREKGYENCWGVGRHVMGSQIFDYWYVHPDVQLLTWSRRVKYKMCRFDPSRFILEHYVDGDLVNSNHKTNRSKAGPGNLHVWGMYNFNYYFLLLFCVDLTEKDKYLTRNCILGPDLPMEFLQ